MLVSYNGHTIYQVYVKNQNQKKVIKVKNLYIFEDYKTKTSTELSDYNDNKPIFQCFFSKDNNEESEKLLCTCAKSQKVTNIKGKQSTSEIKSDYIKNRKVISIKEK